MQQFPLSMRLLIIFANLGTFIGNYNFKFMNKSIFKMDFEQIPMQEYLSLDMRTWRRINDDAELCSLFVCKIMLMNRILELLPIYASCCLLVVSLFLLLV